MTSTKDVKIISLREWNQLVETTYGKIYDFQQQNGCRNKGFYPLTVPGSAEDFENDSIADKINGESRGVSFSAWLNRDVRQWNGALHHSESSYLELFWQRNFYPSVEIVANDLHAKGLLPAGEYCIVIDW